MPDDPQTPDAAAAPVIPLPERVEARYRELRAKDRTVRRYESHIAKDLTIIAATKQRISVGLTAIRSQERWLRKEAAAQIGREIGVRPIPGFGAKDQSPSHLRKQIAIKYKLARTVAMDQLRT